MNSQQSHHLLLTGVSSACATVLSKFLIYPIESIKTKVQVNSMTKLFEPGLILKLTKQTFQAEGIRGFYRGVLLATVGSTPACALYFMTYQFFKIKLADIEFFKNHHNSWRFFVSGFMAEVVSCVMWVPLDVIKERMQAQSEMNYKYRSSSEAMRSIVSFEGLKKGLYRAYGGTLLYFGPFSALYFTIYEQLKRKYLKQNEKPTFVKSAMMAGASGIFSGILCNPMDLAKIRMQVDKMVLIQEIPNREPKSKPTFGYKNTFDGIYKIVKNQGFFGLYKGSLIRIWTTGPITALIMGFTQTFRTKLKAKFPYTE